jgi:hypothetical protein
MNTDSSTTIGEEYATSILLACMICKIRGYDIVPTDDLQAPGRITPWVALAAMTAPDIVQEPVEARSRYGAAAAEQMLGWGERERALCEREILWPRQEWPESEWYEGMPIARSLPAAVVVMETARLVYKLIWASERDTCPVCRAKYREHELEALRAHIMRLVHERRLELDERDRSLETCMYCGLVFGEHPPAGDGKPACPPSAEGIDREAM